MVRYFVIYFKEKSNGIHGTPTSNEIVVISTDNVYSTISNLFLTSPYHNNKNLNQDQEFTRQEKKILNDLKKKEKTDDSE